MKIRVDLTQEEIITAVQDYVDAKIHPIAEGRPRVKFVSQADGNKRLFHLEVHFEMGSRMPVS